MYLGKIVELASRDALFAKPLHPYTGALLSAIPIPNPREERQRERIILIDDIPSPSDPPKGCRFHTRCAYNDNDRCIRESPLLREIVPGHFSACHYAEKIDL
jgi:oligopeptide/dipeptide ABC transporter ATP-binding protein